MVCQRYVRDPFYSRLGQEIVKQFRSSRVAQRFVPEREFSNSSKSALSHEQHGSCAEFLKQIWELLARKLGTCTKTDTSSTACEKFFRPQSRTCQENVVASRSDCEDRNREPFVDSGATLHMSKTTSLENQEICTVIVTTVWKDRRKKPQRTSTMWTLLSHWCCWKIHGQHFVLVYCAQMWNTPAHGKRESFRRCQKMGTLQCASLGTMCQWWQVPKNFVYPITFRRNCKPVA